MGFADDGAELRDAARSWRRVRQKCFAGEFESLSAWEVSKKNFSKVLDGDAKADQNLASLLLTTNAMRMLIVVKAELKSVEKRNFQKCLTTKQTAN